MSAMSLSGQIRREYRLLQPIGEGAHGIVYRAVHLPSSDMVAIKVIHSEYTNDPKMMRRIEQEANIINDLKHPNIIALHDYWQDEEGILLVMPWIDGDDLRVYIQREGMLSLSRTIEIITQIADALDVAHANQIIHRDIKPENILIHKDGTSYLADFGIAKRQGYEAITSMGAVVGSPAYLSPEQLMGWQLMPQTDIFAFAITTCEMLTGKHPLHRIGNSMQIMMHITQQPLPDITVDNPNLPPEIMPLLHKATHQNARERYEKASDFAKALKGLLLNI